jgi:putative oxidoreductase
MERWLGRYADIAYTALRVMAGLMFAMHGAAKLFGMFGGKAAEAPKMIFAGVVELGGGLLIAAGLLTGFAAFLASGQMAVAYWTAHATSANWWNPMANRGELSALYCFVFLYIACRGHGGGNDSGGAACAWRCSCWRRPW